MSAQGAADKLSERTTWQSRRCCTQTSVPAIKPQLPNQNPSSYASPFTELVTNVASNGDQRFHFAFMAIVLPASTRSELQCGIYSSKAQRPTQRRGVCSRRKDANAYR